MPENQTSQFTFEDIFDLDEIQALQDQFADATGVASIITRPDGTPITKPSNFTRLCRDIIRKTEKGLANCIKSDALIGELNEKRPTIQQCLSGGLWDAGAGISQGGIHIANWLIGQVRDETQKDESIRQYARKIGAEEEDVVAAFHEVPAMSAERFDKIARVLFTLAKQLSAQAYQNLGQKEDLATREQSQDQLQQWKALHHSLLKAIPDLIWVKDPAGIYLSCNPAFEEFIGAPMQEVAGKSDYDFFEKELADSFRHHDQQSIAAAGPRKNEEWLTFAGDGYRGLFETIKTPMYDSEGSLTGVQGIARDITHLKKAEKDLLESQERFKALHNASFGGIVIHDKGIILECNQGLVDMTGYSEEELIGKDGLLLIAEQDRKLVMQNIIAGIEAPYEALGLRKNEEEFPMQLQGRNVPYKGKQVRTVEFRDITQDKKAEADHAHLQAQLNQAQKMETVGLLAGGIAHDFNNLLQVILGYGDIVLDELGSDHPSRPAIVQISEAGHRARTLISQLLAFSRRQLLEMRSVDLNESIENMLKMLDRLIGEHISLVFHPGHNLGSTLADTSQLGQILTNLCVNARDAMPEGGQISIETENVVIDEQFQKAHPWSTPGRYVLLSITDNGFGMDRATLDQVFEPFFTTKEVGAGSGLGLSTVYGLVKQHDGFVHVYSEIGQGSTFKIYLPMTERPAAEVGTKIAKPVVGGRETILLAEDDEMVRQLTQTILERNGYTLLVAENGQEAIEIFDQHAPEIDLVLLDVIMPKLGGKAVYDHIHKTYPDLPALFASGYSLNAIHTNFVLDENLAVIQKPAKREELLSKVREVLDGAKNR